MATLGFEEIMLGIHDGDTEVIDTVYTINASSGGAIEAKLSGLQAQANTLYASNVPFYVSAIGTGTPQLDLSTADLSDEILAAISGATLENGIIKLGSKSAAPYVSVILKARGLKDDDIYIGLLKGKFGHPDGANLKTAEDKGQEPDTTDGQMTGSFVNRKFDNYVYAKGRTSATGFTFAAFQTFVFNGYTPTP
jgi:phi13 family phage major tail protein